MDPHSSGDLQIIPEKNKYKFNFDKKKKKKLKNIFEDYLRCPITKCFFFSPSLASDGYIYEDDAIRECNKSPLTRGKIDRIMPIPLIENLVEVSLKIWDDFKSYQLIDNFSFENNVEIVLRYIKNKNYQKIKLFKDFKLFKHSEAYNSSLINHICTYKSDEIIYHIIQNADDINKIIGSGLNIFHYLATACTEVSIFEYIFEKVDKSYINLPTNDGYSPIFYAIGHRNSTAFFYLIDKGVELEHCTTFGQKVIHSLVENMKDEETVLKVLDKFKDFKSCNSEGKTPFIMALEKKFYKVAKILFEKKQYDEKNLLLQSLKYCDDDDFLKLILQDSKDIDWNSTNENGWRIPHVVTMYSCFNVFKIVIDSCQDLEVETPQGWRPIHLACYYRKPEFIEYLLSKNVCLTCPIKKFQNSESSYLPINLLELNKKLKEDEFVNLESILVQMMSF